MRALRAAKTGAIDAYAEHIQALSIRYPDYWGVISLADTVMRSERWPRMRQQFEAEARSGVKRAFWTQKVPWTAILTASVGEEARNWWFDHVGDPIDQRQKGGAKAIDRAAATHTGNLPTLASNVSPWSHSPSCSRCCGWRSCCSRCKACQQGQASS